MKWKTKRTIEELYAGGGMKNVVVVNADEAEEEISKIEYKVEHWKNAALCNKPRGSCRTCKTVNCHYSPSQR